LIKKNGVNAELTEQDITTQGYIYLIVPSIIDLVQKNKEALCIQENDNIVLEDKTIFTVRRNLKAY
jgi:hypothetical protein